MNASEGRVCASRPFSPIVTIQHGSRKSSVWHAGIHMIQYFINWAGRNLPAPHRRELARAKRILQAIVHAALFVLTHYAALLGLGAVSYAIGRKLTVGCAFLSICERVAVCTTLGLGAIAYLVFALCLGHWLYPQVVVGLLAASLLWGAREIAAAARDMVASLREGWEHGRGLAIAAGALVIFLPPAFAALYPPFLGDAIYYHLALAKLYVQHHGFVFAPHVHFSLFPQLAEMLFTGMLAIFDDVAAESIVLLMLALVALSLYVLGERLFSKTVACWAPVILLANPMVIFLGSVAYIDIGLTLFATIALYACWNCLQDRGSEWLILTAIFAGLAAGTKYTGLFFVALTGAAVVGAGMRRRRYTGAVVFFAVAAAVAAPWYARSVYYTGNPLFPFFPSVFGYGFWTPADVAREVDDLHGPGHGFGLGPWSFASLPWHLAFRQQSFNTEATGNRLFFLLMPVLLPFALLDRRIFGLCAVIGAYLLVWFFGSQEMRYLVPVFPLISLGFAAPLTTLLQAAPVRRLGPHALVAGIVFAVVAYPGWTYGRVWARTFGPPPVTLVDRDRFLSRRLATYPAYQFLNARNGEHYSLYAFEDQFMAYYCDGTFMGDIVGPGRYARIKARLGDGRALYGELRLLGADYLLIPTEGDRPLEDQFFRAHFRLVYARPGVQVFEIARSPD